MTMRFYRVLEDGTLEEEQEFIQDSTKVIIIVDDQFKRIFLWKGANSGIKKKFIGSRAAAELRKTYYGFAYRLSVVEEGDETQEFDFTIRRSRGEVQVGVIEDTTRGIPTSPSEMGLDEVGDIKLAGEEPAKRIIYSDEEKVGIGQFAGAPQKSRDSESEKPRPKRPAPPTPAATQRPKPQRTILSEMMGGKEPKIIRPAPGTQTAKRYSQQSGTAPEPKAKTPPPKPTATTAAPQPVSTTAPPRPSTQTLIEEINPNESFSLIKELGLPAGFERDLVIVGTKIYRQQGEEFLVPPDPPEGIFLAPDRVPRIIIENGVVKVIEILRKIEDGKKEKEEIVLEQDIEDLMSTFMIEVE